MIVYLLRHGIAEEHSRHGGDAARELTADGVQRLERATRGWRRIVGVVDTVLASPLVRAQQTAAIFHRAVAAGARLETEAALTPTARPLDMLLLLQALAESGRAGVACVGHEPHLGNLLGLLLTGSERTVIPFKKGMLAAVELDGATTMIGRLIAAMSQRIAGDC